MHELAERLLLVVEKTARNGETNNPHEMPTDFPDPINVCHTGSLSSARDRARLAPLNKTSNQTI
jgi:hypothetical protein